MASKEQIKSFIETLSALAIAECVKRDKKVCPSVCIAQAALESGWGSSALMKKANAYFGIKASKGWGGGVYSAATKECYDGVGMTDTTALFRAYGSLADSVCDYYNLITESERYSGAVGVSDYRECIAAIAGGGYATDPDYEGKIRAIIENYGLDKYDSCMSGGYAEKVASLCGLEAQTVDYINGYKYASDLWRKLYERMV